MPTFTIYYDKENDDDVDLSWSAQGRVIFTYENKTMEFFNVANYYKIRKKFFAGSKLNSTIHENVMVSAGIFAFIFISLCWLFWRLL